MRRIALFAMLAATSPAFAQVLPEAAEIRLQAFRSNPGHSGSCTITINASHNLNRTIEQLTLRMISTSIFGDSVDRVSFSLIEPNSSREGRIFLSQGCPRDRFELRVAQIAECTLLNMGRVDCSGVLRPTPVGQRDRDTQVPITVRLIER